MTIHNWASLPSEQLNPLFSRKVFHTQNLTVARIHLLKGAMVKEHSHVNEQVSLLLQGQIKFRVAGEECILKAGEALTIPPSAPHSVVALEESVVIDIFCPVRQDWIDGTDDYLRK